MSDITPGEIVKWAQAEIEQARDRLEAAGDPQIERGRIKALRDLISFIGGEKTPAIGRPANFGLTLGPPGYA